jgi:hypothetical protein
LEHHLGADEYVTPNKLAEHPAGRVVGTLRRLWRAKSMTEICDDMGGWEAWPLVG